MDKVTWRHQCFVCKRPIRGGKPCVVFSTDKTELVGLCHSRCSYGLYQYDYGWFQMCPPDYLSEEQLSFLVQFYYRLYNLPGGQEPNRELRICLATLLSDYPASMVNPMVSFRTCLDEYKRWSREWLYEGDLETDFLRILGHIQRATREMPVKAEIDFRT